MGDFVDENERVNRAFFYFFSTGCHTTLPLLLNHVELPAIKN